MDFEERFDRIESQLNEAQPPSWSAICATLDFPDERWRNHDPADALAAFRAVWQQHVADWTDVTALWLGIQTDGTTSYLCPIAYGSLDDTGFPNDHNWHGVDIDSADLAAFAGYFEEDHDNNAYNYWAPLAWTGLMVRLLAPAPPTVTVLAGFAGGDWLTFPPTA